jgi:hypothetical protein
MQLAEFVNIVAVRTHQCWCHFCQVREISHPIITSSPLIANRKMSVMSKQSRPRKNVPKIGDEPGDSAGGLRKKLIEN